MSSPAWYGFWIRRRPGWERRIRSRRLAAVVLCCVLSLSGSYPSWVDTPYRVVGITKTGAFEWTLEFRWMGEEDSRAVVASSRETILMVDHAMWMVGR